VPHPHNTRILYILIFEWQIGRQRLCTKC
jgi:hypothetical protein